MRNENQNRYANIAVYVLIVIVVGAVFVMALFGLRDYVASRKYTAIFKLLNPFIIGCVLAYLLNPLMSLYERRVYAARMRAHTRRILSLASAFFSMLIVISLIMLMVFPQVGASVNQLTVNIIDLFSPAEGANPVHSSPDVASFLEDADLDDLLHAEDNWFNYDALMNTKLGVRISDTAASTQKTLSDLGFHVDIEQSMRNMILTATAEMTVYFGMYYQSILNATASLIITTAKQLLNIVIGIIIAIYILLDKEHLIAQIKQLLYGLLPVKAVNKIIAVTRTTHHTFNGFFTGKLLDSLIIGIICFVCMSLFRINYPMLISVIIAITNIIPFFGPFIGAIPSIIFLSINDIGQGLWFAVFILILQQVDGNIIGPKILGSTIGISSLWIIFSIVVFSSLLGPIGLFIGVPVFGVIYALLKDYTAKRIKKKGLPASVLEPGASDAFDMPEIVLMSGKAPAIKPPAEDYEGISSRFSGLVEHLSRNIQAIINKRRPDDDEDDDYYSED